MHGYGAGAGRLRCKSHPEVLYGVGDGIEGEDLARGGQPVNEPVRSPGRSEYGDDKAAHAKRPRETFEEQSSPHGEAVPASCGRHGRDEESVTHDARGGDRHAGTRRHAFDASY